MREIIKGRVKMWNVEREMGFRKRRDEKKVKEINREKRKYKSKKKVKLK